MKSAVLMSAPLLAFCLGYAPVALADETAELIASAVSAGPAAVTADAVVYGFAADGSMMTLREGSNGWWCLPNDPSTPTEDPMCGDANAMDWAKAWMGKTLPTPGKVGFIYMLQGGSGASNTDPYLTAPADGKWLIDGPHVMVMNATDMMAGYKGGPNPDPTKPYIMWEGTPYAHLMIPVQ